MVQRKRRHRALNNRGSTVVEYALIAMLIAVVIYGAVEILGINVQGLFNTVVNAFP